MVYLERHLDCLRNVSIMILMMIFIALMCTRIPPSPYNFKRVIKYQTFQTPFLVTLSVTNIAFWVETNFGSRSIQSNQTVAIMKGD